MPLDSQNLSEDLLDDLDLIELIPIVQLLVEEYAWKVLRIHEQWDFLDKIRLFYRLYGNKRAMISLSWKDNLPKVIIEDYPYYVELKTSLENIRKLTCLLLKEIAWYDESQKKTPKN